MSIDSLFPEALSTNIPIKTILPTGSKYGTIAISASGEIYSFRSLTKEPFFEKIEEVSFKGPCKDYVTNAEYPFVCGTGTRDYQIVDLEKQEVYEGIISNNGNDRFFLIYLFKGKKPILLLTVDHVGWSEDDSYEETYQYDFESQMAIKIIDQYYGSLLFQLSENQFLRADMQRKSQPSIWQLLNGNLKERISNKLTDSLCKLNPRTYEHCFNSNKRMLICSTLDTNFTKYTITWDSLFEDISIVPWTFQDPKDYFTGKQFFIDRTGNWLRNTVRMKDGNKIVLNAFYHISDKYPAHVSIPIFGMETNRSITGAFLETPEWGTVYVDLTHGLEGVLMVYKMRDVMAKIIERAKEMK